MYSSEFDYTLPEELIALRPVKPRDHSRLMVINRPLGTIKHYKFTDLPNFLSQGDLLVRNDSKVIPARLFGTDSKGTQFEVLLLKNTVPFDRWQCLCRPGRKVKSKLKLSFPLGVEGEIQRMPDEVFEIEFKLNSNAKASQESQNGLAGEDSVLDWIFQVGSPPLPPYIKRICTNEDQISYQTIYAAHIGSVAAPTAGLHFTEEIFTKLQANGVQIADLTLHVGYGTFSSIRVDKISEHKMHKEFYSIPLQTISQIQATRTNKRQIVAVGTTSLRAIESASKGGTNGSTDLFITPGYQFKNTDSLITNFHLPKSSLYVLVTAFMGKDLTHEAYQKAIENRYRFYSYGDAMLIL